MCELYPSQETQLRKTFTLSFEWCLRELLENKFLYQNCKIIAADVLETAKKKFRISGADRACENVACDFVSCKMDFGLRKDINNLACQIPIPSTVNTGCEFCKEITPHNPIEATVISGGLHNNAYNQTICIGMQCQKCKCGRLVVLVRRDGLRLQLVGRNQVDAYVFPYALSYFSNAKEIKNVFVDAVMAERTGSHLAAICLLRVALEQFMRSAVASSFSKMRGDELYDEFARHLPADFPRGRVCSLTEVYGRLSEVMHAPSSYKEGEFNELFDKLLNYFKYLELMPLEEIGEEIVNESKSQLAGEVASAEGGTNG